MNTESTRASPRICAIVLNWNGGERIHRCVQSLLASTGAQVNVVVVDNGSTDGSNELLAVTFASISLIRLGKNIGLAKARNEGLRWSMEQGFDAMLFIDDDARVAPDTLSQLWQTLQSSPQAGIVTPRILDGNNEKIIWYDGGVTNTFGDPVHRNMGAEAGTVTRESLEIEFGTGCCQLIKREVVEQIGLLDETFFVYSEDADYSFRAREAAFRIVHVPGAIAWHEQSGDTKKNKGKWYRDYYVTRNKLMLFSKHYKGMKFIVALVGFGIVDFGFRIGYFMVMGEFRRCRAIFDGVTDFLCGRFGERYA
ncbi:MAG: glycosyltransferase family 2 protein [Bacteroidota bacterium]